MAGQFQLKRKSSICIRIEEERGDVYSATRSNSRNSDALRKQLSEADGEGSSDDLKTKTLQQTQEYNTGQDDDTDILSLSDSDTIQLEPDTQEASMVEDEQIQRLSSRIKSMKRRGRINLERYKSIKFLYVANDYLAVRGGGSDFYLCRVIEDVLESSDPFNIAWLDRVDAKKQHYKMSYDDVCYQGSVIDRVNVTELEDGLCVLMPKYLRRVKKLLKEALRLEGADDLSSEGSDIDADESLTENEDENDKEDEAPPRKKRKKAETTPRKKTTPTKEREKKTPTKKEKVATLRKRRGLVPNDSVDVVDKDPLFYERSDLPIAHVKRGLRGVLLNDMKMLKDAIFDLDNVFTVFWNRSIDIKLGPVHYALLTENKEALDLLFSKDNPSQSDRKAPYPASGPSRMTTGKYNFYTFGHAVRPIEASRGAKEGDNAFLKEDGSRYPDSDVSLQFCLKRNLSPEIILHYWALNKKDEAIVDDIDIAVRHGHRKLAAYFIKKEADKDNLSSRGMNFLHKETLVNDSEPLSKFKTQSVTKKAYPWGLLPLHCAAINPNPKYLQKLFSVVPDYQLKDNKGRKLIHYAAACEGSGPLKFLLSRGADPNDIDNKGTTPLMIAAKLGRNENVVELASVTVSENDSASEEEDDEMEGEKKPSASVEIKRVNINAKHRKTTKAPLHYAAKNGHESTVALLVEHGANVNLPAGAGKGNFTALVFAAEQGHLNVVKKLVELGAAPDVRVRHRKTALMIAAQNGNYPVMSYLLRIGVNPNAQDSSLNTPIHYAAAYNWYHCLKLLLDSGADPNTANNWKTTPLSIALQKDNLKCAELLLNTDVNINFPDDKGSTILMNQMLSNLDDGVLEKVRFLVESKDADVKIKDMAGSTALHYLASNSMYEYPGSQRDTNRRGVRFSKSSSDICIKIAEILIKAGADVNAVKEDGHTPLLVALLQNNFPLVELLIKNNADVNIKGECSELKPPLHSILSIGSTLESFDLLELFEKQENLKKYDGMDHNKLRKIYKKHSDEIEEKFFHLLIDSGADLEALNGDGDTALMMAISNGSVERVRQLISYGADPLYGKKNFNQNGLHSLALACTQADYSHILSSLKKNHDLSKLVNQVDNNGFTPFLLACEKVATEGNNQVAVNRCYRFLKVLIEECNANVNVDVAERANFGKDESSVKYRNVANFGLIISKGRVTENDQFELTGKFTCFHFLAMVWKAPEDSDDMISYLAKHTQDGLINARCRHGRTALHQAIKHSNFFAVAALIKAGIDVNLPSLDEDYDHMLDSLSLVTRPKFQFDIAEELLKAKSDPNFKNPKDGRTALSFACVNDPDSMPQGISVLRLVTDLIASGADVNSLDFQNRSPLHYLVSTSSGGYEVLTEIEELLISHGANLFTVDCDGKLPLFYSFCKLGKCETSVLDPIAVVSLLCNCAEKLGKLPTMLAHKDNLQRTMLHYAAMRGAVICSSYFLKHGASVVDLDVEGNSPISLALRSGHHGCAMLMLQHNNKLPCWDVITPVTKEQLEKYDKKLAKHKWRSSNFKTIEKPEAIKKTAFQLAIENDWPGVAYSILEDGAIILLDAFKAALKANKIGLALNLLRQRSGYGDFHHVDEKKCNMFHVLAAHADKDAHDYGKLMQIANFLIKKKVDASSPDVDGILPIHLAASHANVGLSKLLIEYYHEGIGKANNEGVTPLVAVVSSAVDNGCKFTSNHIRLIKHLINEGVSTLDVCFYTGTNLSDGRPETTTILNELLLTRNEGNFAEDTWNENKGCIEYFLEKGADINFANSEGITPLMLAVDLNYPDMVELLLKHKNIKLDLKPKSGDSLMHICVGSREEFYQERTEIFKLLKSKRVSLEELDKEGHPPVYYAMKQSSGLIAGLFPYRLRKDLTPSVKDSTAELFPFEAKIDKYWIKEEIDIQRDAKEELKGLNDIPMDNVPPVDSALNMADTGIVYADEETGIYYDVVLSKVDVRWGRYGLNSFYKLQVVHHKGKQLWILFNRWGRIGDRGQHQQTPFNTPEEACNEFKKIFKSKTGNKWEALDSFQRVPKKYALLKNEKNPERMLHRKDEILKPFDLDKCPETNLPDELKRFMEKITSFNLFTSYIHSGRFDSKFMPFGLISRENIEEAKKIIAQLREVLPGDDCNELDEKRFEKVAELSNNLFMLVPPDNYAYEEIRPLNSVQELDNFKESLEDLTQLSVASELFLAAQHNKKVTNPLDYCFKALNVHLEIMDHTSTECQYIMEYLENSFEDEKPPVIAGIYRVKRPSEDETFDNHAIKKNRQLLWHGTHSAHMIGILTDGLKVDAKNVRRIGRSLGDGIYFSESFCKSLNYSCHTRWSKDTGFVFLCEVAMGKICTDLEKKGDSFVRVPSKIPDPAMDCFTPYGAKLPRGSLIENEDVKDKCWWTQEHECVVFDAKQVKIRYLVMTE